MAMGLAAVVSAAGKGTGAISRGALGDDGSATTAGSSTVVTDPAPGGGGATAIATGETAVLGAALRAASGDGGFGAGSGASITAGLELAAAGTPGAAGLRCLA